MIKVLTQNSVDNTNIDGARQIYFSAGNRSGIIKGSLNEGRLFLSSSNTLSLDTCALFISGHYILITEPISYNFLTKPSKPTRYAYVAQIKVINGNPDFSLIMQSAITPLIQDNLFKTEKGDGTYQLELGRVTLLPNGMIEDPVRTADVITGGKSEDGSEIYIGTVTTNTLASGLEAEFDVDSRFDEVRKKWVIDFKVGIPKGADGKTTVNVAGVAQDRLDFTSDPQAQIDKLSNKFLRNTDLNTVKDRKAQYDCINCTNTPSSTGNGTVIVFASADTYIEQIFVASTGVIYNRYFDPFIEGGKWQVWKRLLNQSDVAQETGNSTSRTMSQATITNLINDTNANVDKLNGIYLGQGATLLDITRYNNNKNKEFRYYGYKAVDAPKPNVGLYSMQVFYYGGNWVGLMYWQLDDTVNGTIYTNTYNGTRKIWSGWKKLVNSLAYSFTRTVPKGTINLPTDRPCIFDLIGSNYGIVEVKYKSIGDIEKTVTFDSNLVELKIMTSFSKGDALTIIGIDKNGTYNTTLAVATEYCNVITNSFYGNYTINGGR